MPDTIAPRAEQHEAADDHGRAEPPVHPAGQHHEADHRHRDHGDRGRDIAEQRALQPAERGDDRAGALRIGTPSLEISITCADDIDEANRPARATPIRRLQRRTIRQRSGRQVPRTYLGSPETRVLIVSISIPTQSPLDRLTHLGMGKQS
jgi:hypothetical protein